MRFLRSVPTSTATSRRRRRLVSLLAVLGVVAACSTWTATGPVSANVAPTRPPGAPLDEVPAEVLLTELADGHSVVGFLGPVGSVSDPAVPYPPSHSGFPFHAMDFAGLVEAEPESGSPTLRLYCTDIRTDTSIGYGYDLGDWSTAGTQHAGYVARILADYYPAEDLPAIGSPGIANDDQRAAAVQAAIWYFTDNYVVQNVDPRFDAVSEIVNAVRVQAPLPAPAAPSLEVSPGTATGTTGSVVGPFTIATSAAEAVVSVSGAQMYADVAGNVPLASPATIDAGDRVYLRSSTVGPAELSASASLTMPTGSAYLYNGNIAGVTDAQNLILADSATMTSNSSAQITFQAPTTTTSTTVAPTSTVAPTIPPTTVGPNVPSTVPATTAVPATTTLDSDVNAGSDGRDGSSPSDAAAAGAAPSRLAMTGDTPAWLVPIALALLVAGAVVLAGSRRSGVRRGSNGSVR